MPDVFLGQVMMTGFAFAPAGFAACNGAVISIGQNQALFSLLGTRFGGDGQSTFALPDLRSRTPAGFGRSVDPEWQPVPYDLGQSGGVEAVTLLAVEMPAHSHAGVAAPRQRRVATRPTRSMAPRARPSMQSRRPGWSRCPLPAWPPRAAASHTPICSPTRR